MMWSCKKMVVQLMLYFLVILVLCSGRAPEYAYHICRNRTAYSSNSLFQADREALLSKLSKLASNDQ